MPSFNTILQNGIFTFKVGAEETPFVIHKQLVESHSAVLATLMNNGAMAESIAGVACLPEVEVETFALFAEYVYTGFYRLVELPSGEYSKWFHLHCYECEAKRVVPGSPVIIPTECPCCNGRHIAVGDIEKRVIIKNTPTVSYFRAAYKRKWSSPAYSDIFPRHDSLATDNSSGAELFRKRSYPALGRSHRRVVQHLAALRPSDLVSEEVTAHAKLYVFANTYMVYGLKRLCLHKLHRDLVQLTLSSENVNEIVRLVAYTNENTTGNTSESLRLAQDPTQVIVNCAYEEESFQESIKKRSNTGLGRNILHPFGDATWLRYEDVDNASNQAVAGWEANDRRPDPLRTMAIHSIRNAKTNLNTVHDKELRDLVMSYAIVVAHKLMVHPAFMSALHENERLANDLMAGMCNDLKAIYTSDLLQHLKQCQTFNSEFPSHQEIPEAGSQLPME